ncbi:hypothetical protein [Allomuricauda sp. M10]|uniref:hypothetical protein n=1 Tax=Allomuricauda sp. M10 TaxID=2683292 RepID=UPI001D196CBD|nr:hypothetical protein [Muricauda sp. M10]
MKTPEQILLDILENETARLNSDCPKDINLFAMIEIIRSVDYHSFILSHNPNDPGDTFLLQKYRFGWSLAFSQFYKNYHLQDNIPLFAWEHDLREWINSVIQHAGSIELCKQFLDYAKADLVKVENDGHTFNFKYKRSTTPYEYYEKKSLEYYFSTVNKHLEEKSRLIVEGVKKMRKELETIVNVEYEQFMSYTATPKIDEFYSKWGYLYLMNTTVVEDFAEDDKFGNHSYKDYLDFVEDIFKVGIMHRDCSMALVEKTSQKIHLRNILTYVFSKSSFVKLCSEYMKWSEEKTTDILSAFTLSLENFQFHLQHPGATVPPYFQLGNDTIMRSTVGCLDKPLLFLHRELKRKYHTDYFEAVNKREQRFKEQLYSLFPEKKIVKVSDNINIKIGSRKTDIDGVLYDTERSTLGLFQLKWQDAFSTSMKERFSRISNLIPKSVEWIDKVEDWIKYNDKKTILSSLKIPKEYSDIEEIYIFVISRNHAHFTNQKLDNRATWASWYQVLEACSKVKDPSNSNPIGELALKLRMFYPEERTKREENPIPSNLSFKFSKFKVNIQQNSDE